jgi:hypothetical protein
MERDELPSISADSIAERLRELAPGEHAHPGQHETVREAEYRGHRIVVRTTYAIEVDGRPIEGHLGVSNDGRVHYHPVPNLAFPSAIDMVKQLIDTFPDDFASDTDGGGNHDHDHDHDQDHDHDDHDPSEGHHDHGSHSGAGHEH